MTRRINISGIIFNVEPVGYEILQAYLNAWSQFSKQTKTKLEEMAAEYLLQQLNGSNVVTTTDHVERMHQALPEIPFPTTDNSVKKHSGWHLLSRVALGLW
jgi:hypothetical protein